MIHWVLNGALALLSLSSSEPAHAANGSRADQNSGSFAFQNQDPQTSQVEDVLIVGRRFSEGATRYVRAVAAPVDDRGVARWREPVCVGVANINPDVARAVADRVSDWAAYLGLSIDTPGCEANIVVVFAPDGGVAARELVAAQPRQFATGFAGADFGRAALQRFQNSERLVRWWYVSLPTDPRTGLPIGRPPGEAPLDVTGRPLRRPSEFGLNQSGVTASRLTRQLRDDFQRIVVVVDIDALDRASLVQISDFVAFVALAQINPEIEAGDLDSILRLFDSASEAPASLTAWDRAFLRGVYAADQTSRNPAANRAEVARLMGRRLQQDSSTPEVP